MDWNPHSKQLFVVCGRQCHVIPVDYGHCGDSKDITCLNPDSRPNILACVGRNGLLVGNRDGELSLLDDRTNFSAASLTIKTSSSGNRNSAAILSLAVENEDSVICSSSENPVQIWDLRKPYSSFCSSHRPAHFIRDTNGAADLDIFGSQLFVKTRKEVLQFDIASFNNRLVRRYVNCGGSSRSRMMSVDPLGGHLAVANSVKDEVLVYKIPREDFLPLDVDPLVSLPLQLGPGLRGYEDSIQWMGYGSLAVASNHWDMGGDHVQACLQSWNQKNQLNQKQQENELQPRTSPEWSNSAAESAFDLFTSRFQLRRKAIKPSGILPVVEADPRSSKRKQGEIARKSKTPRITNFLSILSQPGA